MISATLLCLVVGITDGDTLKARCGDPGAYQQITVRLAAIDAPESRQPFGRSSRQHLAALCHQREAVIQPRARDRYGRTVADVACAGQDAGRAQVAAGMAWVYDRYVAAQDAPLYDLQRRAHAAGAGLWADAETVPPWDWRRQARRPAAVPR